MARRRNAPPPEPAPEQPGHGERAEHRPRVLIVSGSRAERARLASKLADGDCGRVGECVLADSARSALDALIASPCELAIVRAELPDGSGMDLARALCTRENGPATILLSENPTLEQAVAALRSGAVDIVSCAGAGGELINAMRTAVERARRERERRDRLDKLTRVCRKLNQARHEVTRQVSSLCVDMLDAYQELSGKVVQLGIASEFASLVRHELDVESLLRTALEFVLAKVGPTNAAVLLPSSSGDFSLGAYVNYDCPKDTADVLLEHMASMFPPRMERQIGLRALATCEQMEEFLGDDAHWLADSCAVAFACRHEEETLAVVVLFRDRRTPFPERCLPTLGVVADLFGKQLGRVVRIHHRHLPKEQWGGFGADERDDDIDMAA